MTPRRVYVGPGRQAPPIPAGLLRGHVQRSPDLLIGERLGGVVGQDAGHSEVGHDRLERAAPIRRRQEHVAWLEVAVEDAVLVGVLDGPGECPDDAGGLGRGHGARAIGKPVGQGWAGDVPGGDVR